jgi:hypothetical protein
MTPVYDKRIKDLAYEIWRVDTRQSMKTVAEKLNALEGMEIPSDTVDHWRKSHQWQVRWTEERQALSPRMLERHLVGLRVAAPELIEKLRRHVHASSARDEYGNPIDPDFLDISQVHAAKHLITENRFTASLIVISPSGDDAKILSAPLTMEQLKEQEEAIRARSLPPGLTVIESP